MFFYIDTTKKTSITAISQTHRRRPNTPSGLPRAYFYDIKVFTKIVL